MIEFRLHVRDSERNPAWERCSVLHWVRNDDVNGALVGWWMCEELCSSRAQECASSLSKSSPALWYHVFPAACSTLARTPALILPSGRSGNTCICQNGGNMEARERMIPTDPKCNLEVTVLQQLKKKESGRLNRINTCVLLCQYR